MTPLDRFFRGVNRLRRLRPDLPLLAVQWMSVKHPIYPLQERLMGEPVHAGSRESPWLLTLLQGLLYAMFSSVNLFQIRWILRQEIAELRKQGFHLVAKTWSFGPRKEPSGPDFYYGDLQQRLSRRGIRMLLLCGDASADALDLKRWREFARTHTDTSQQPRMPELALVPPWVPFRLFFRQAATGIRLFRVARRLRPGILRTLSGRASQDCANRQATDNGLSFWAARSAVRAWHPYGFLALYEANSWERCGWWGAKSADPLCRTVGYQHTALFPYAYSLTRPYLDIRERSFPDVVLCIGENTLERMRLEHERHGVRLIRFGSFRYNGSRAVRPADPTRKAILVAPEGILTEAVILFAFTRECARRLPDYRFILRSHPLIPIEQPLESVPGLRELPNVLISEERSIEADFQRSSALLVRGSSAVLYGILQGLYPIHFSSGLGIDPDPIFDLTCWKGICRTAEDCAALLKRQEEIPEGDRLVQWRMACDYVDRTTGPVRERGIEELLESVGLQEMSTVPPDGAYDRQVIAAGRRPSEVTG